MFVVTRKKRCAFKIVVWLFITDYQMNYIFPECKTLNSMSKTFGVSPWEVKLKKKAEQRRGVRRLCLISGTASPSHEAHHLLTDVYTDVPCSRCHFLLLGSTKRLINCIFVVFVSYFCAKLSHHPVTYLFQCINNFRWKLEARRWGGTLHSFFSKCPFCPVPFVLCSQKGSMIHKTVHVRSIRDVIWSFSWLCMCMSLHQRVVLGLVCWSIRRTDGHNDLS